MMVLSKKEQYTLEIATAIINNFQHNNKDLVDWMSSVDWEEFFKRVEFITENLLHNINRDFLTKKEVEKTRVDLESEIDKFLANIKLQLNDNTEIDVDKDGCIIPTLIESRYKQSKNN